MRRWISIKLLICVFSMIIAGCQQEQPVGRQFWLDKKIQTDTGRFPRKMIGIWEVEITSKDNKWGLKFESDGTLLRIIHPVAGPVDLEEGDTSWEGPEGAFYIFTFGPCEAEYESKSRVLEVRVVLEYFKMKFPSPNASGGEIEGRMEDYLWGPVSEDGKTWKVKWTSYGWIEGVDPPDVKLIAANPETLVFTKVDMEKLKEKAEQEQQEN